MVTKLRMRTSPRATMPQSVSGDIRRARLISRLDAGLHEQWTTTLVSAPAGSGKTRLLARWAQDLQTRRGINVAWLTVAPGDNSLQVLRDALSQVDDTGLSRVLSHSTTDLSLRSARLLARAVSSTAFPTVVIVDDVHQISSREFSDCIDVFARSISGNGHIVLSGRDTTPGAFLRTRICGVALELSANDFALTPQEVQRYFADRGARVSQGQVTSILRSTGGSIAALRLTELALVSAPAGFGFTLPQDSVATNDRITEELLRDLDPGTHEFLIRTAFPETFTAGLASALTEDVHAHSIIQRLVRLHVLVEEKRESVVSYRHHPSVRHVLREKILDRSALEAELHARAARWYAEQHEDLLALFHALRATGAHDTDSVLRRSGMRLVLVGHAEHVVGLLKSAPATAAQNQNVRLLRAAANLALGDEAQAVAVLATEAIYDSGHAFAHATDPADLAAISRLWKSGLELQVSVRRGGVEARQPELMQHYSEGEPQLDVYMHLQASMSELYAGRLASADTWAGSACDLARAGDMISAELQASAIRVTIALFRGHFSDVLHRTDLLERRWREVREPVNEYYQIAQLWRGWVMFERLDMVGARGVLDRAAPTIFGGHEAAIAQGVRGMMALFMAELAEDPLSAAIAIGERLAPRDDQPLPPHWFAVAGVPAVHVLNRLGHLDQRDRLISAISQRDGWTGDIAVMSAVARLFDGDLAGARTAVGDVIDGSYVCLADPSMVDAWLVAARLEVLNSNPERAQAALTVALQLAAPEGHIRAFLNAGPIVQQLLAARATSAARGPFAHTVCSALIEAGGKTNTALTEREREVLRGLLLHATLREIAEQQYVSMNTVKTHVRNIYRKLGVSDRESLAIAAHSLMAE